MKETSEQPRWQDDQLKRKWREKWTEVRWGDGSWWTIGEQGPYIKQIGKPKGKHLEDLLISVDTNRFLLYSNIINSIRNISGHGNLMYTYLLFR